MSRLRPYCGLVRIIKVLGLLSAFILAVAVPATAGAASTTAQARVQTYVDTFATPGVAAAVLADGDLETVVSGHDGTGDPITPETRFRIASMSKSMTATAIMLLVKDGAVDLDDQVVDVLPEFTMADPRHEDITIRQLLSHTSGLSLQTNDEFALPAPRTTKAVVAELTDRRIMAEPGSRFEYHNTNFSLAARIIEVVSGQPLDDFLRLRLFIPLGMHDSLSLDACDQKVDDLAPGYSVVLGFSYVMPEMPGRCGGNGGVVSTLADMVQWLRFNQGEIGAEVLDGALLDELHAAQPSTPSYALGWERRAPGDGETQGFVSHGGTLATFTASMAFVPSTGTAAVVLTNGVGSPGELVQNLIADVDGHKAIPHENPLNLVNAVLLGVSALAVVLLTVTALRAPRWAARRRAARRPRVWPRLLPLAVVVVVGLFVPITPALLGGTINWQYWVIDLWLFPLLDVLAAVMVLGGISALVSRVVALRVVPASLRRSLRSAA
ncbi:serine hydrolase [Microbacterium sp. MYb54]|nr:serine hydrolase [Microbacterium sp. MYb43]PQZ82322.1 serine hydrolase [Microbacterium sp. MYb40]PRB23978.1 serine hydrolase [Microbacterium sp. MYb54]PRB30809.1 serine hydrolase [Microbacterium sp. MYb50]PRB70769.1 serine hydrolase [Microbacterium sp. MYb24]PRB79652.1 serine hydrolase [Microbacterium sp. MYb32]